MEPFCQVVPPRHQVADAGAPKLDAGNEALVLAEDGVDQITYLELPHSPTSPSGCGVDQWPSRSVSQICLHLLHLWVVKEIAILHVS